MKYSKPYFKNVPGVGALDVDYVFFEAECPMLFSCIDKNNDVYLCICCDIINEQRWIITPTSVSELIDVIMNKKSLGSVFKKETLFVAHWKRGYQTEIITEKVFSEIDKMDIPDNDDFLDAEEGEFNDYIARLNRYKYKYTPTFFDGFGIYVRSSKNMFLRRGKGMIKSTSENISSYEDYDELLCEG